MRPGLRVVRNDAPTGFSAAANRGVDESKGDLVVLLNSDAELDPESLAAVVGAFDEDVALGIAGAAMRYPDGSPQWSAGPEPGLLWLFAQASGLPALLGRIPGWRSVKPLHPTRPVDVGWVSGAAMALRPEVWRRLGPFDATYAFYGQDLDFCVRAHDAGWKVRHLPSFRVLHLHGATITADEAAPLDHSDLGLLWTDLVVWAGKRRGPAFAARARAALLAGSVLRLAARSAASPFVGRERRPEWRAANRLLGSARRQLRAVPPGAGRPGPASS